MGKEATMTMSYTNAEGEKVTTPPFTGSDLSRAAEMIGKRHKAGKKKNGAPTMKHDPDFAKSEDKAYRVTAGELRQFIERFERLEAEKKDIADQQKEVMAEAKARGYDTRVMRKVIALRKRDKDDIAEEEAVLELYKEALGMA